MKASPPLAILCGGGNLPIEAARAAQNAGRDVFLVGLTGSAEREIETFPHIWVRLGEVGKLFSALQSRGITEVAALGEVARPDFADLLPDWGAVWRAGEISQIFRGGDDRILRGVAQLFENAGYRIVSPADFSPNLFAQEGLIAGPTFDDETRADIQFGAHLLDVIAPFDIGQGVVIAKGRTLAVEAAEGTQAMLTRIAELRASKRLRLKGRCGVFIKAAKRGQDRRLDLPAVGVQTIFAAKEAQLAGLAIAAGEVLIADRPVFLSAAADSGLFVYGWHHEAS